MRLHLRPGVVFSDGAPLTAAAVKASLERSIRLSREAMPAAFAAIAGVAEYLDGKAPDVSGITARLGDGDRDPPRRRRFRSSRRS